MTSVAPDNLQLRARGAEDKNGHTSAQLILFLISFVFFPDLPFHKNPDSHNRTSTDPDRKRIDSQGTVLDPDGPFPSRTLVLPCFRPCFHRTALDRFEGRYRLEGFIQGQLRVLATGTGLSGRSADIELHDAEALNLDLHLKISAVEEQVVVSASLDEALPSQIGSSVSVIAQPEIEARGAENVSEVLRGITRRGRQPNGSPRRSD